MKIGLLTLPLHINYGGVLQCYALQKVLCRMGHEVTLLNRAYLPYKKSVKDYVMDVVKCLTHTFLGREHVYFPTEKERLVLHRHVAAFIDSYIQPQTKPLYSTEELRQQCMADGYDAYVVGSDQVWRPCYTPSIVNYYLDFVPGGNGARRIAYAASFGTDDWEYTADETKVCSQLIGNFNAVSVRESSAIRICRERYGVEATHVLDPTLLLERADYESIVMQEGEEQCEGNLFCYILDSTEQKKGLIGKLVSELSLVPFYSMPSRTYQEKRNMRVHIEDCTYPPVARWIRSFMDAGMVITDSFHGCVFSIIFNKPFWVIGNTERGLSRFTSLLETFGLQDRMILSDEAPDWNKGIDWDKVNKKLQTMKDGSMEFLRNSLR